MRPWRLKKLFPFSQHKGDILIIKFCESSPRFFFAIFTSGQSSPSLKFMWEKELQDQTEVKKLGSFVDLVRRKSGCRLTKIIWLVPEKYVILRRLTLPKLSGKELSSAVRLNVKKILPCKIDDLYYSYMVLNRGQKSDVVFYGILKDYVSRVIPSSFLPEITLYPQDFAIRQAVLGLRPEVREEKAFFMLYEDEGAKIAILADREGNWLIKTLSRTAVLSSELRLMLESYKRIERSVVSDLPIYSLVDVVEEEVRYISPEEVLNWLKRKGEAGSWKDLFLACGAYLGFSSRIFSGVVPSLEEERTKEKSPPKINFDLSYFSSFSEKVPALPIVLCSLVLILGAGSFYFSTLNQYLTLKHKYTRLLSTLPKDVFPRPGDISLQDIDVKRKNLEREISIFETYLKNRRRVSKILKVVKQRFGNNIWLRLPFSLSQDILRGKLSLVLTGGIFLGDEDREVKALDKLVRELRNDLKGYFSDIDFIYLRREQMEDGEEYLAFSVRCV